MADEIRTYSANENVVVYRSADNAVQLEVQLAEETVWLTQKQMAGLFDTTPQNITVHIRNIYKEDELEQVATCKDFLQVQIEGGREIRRIAKYYNLDVIISVGYRIKSKRGIQFRQWATKVYGGLTLHTTQICHDRFLIIDNDTIYLIGASLKDAGKRLFAFTQMDASQISTIKARL